MGAMLGSITLGYISDLMHGRRSPVALVAVVGAAAISFTLTVHVYALSKPMLYFMMFLLGFFINGINNLISCACSADLGKQDALKGNARAISTVTGIIDGTGTMGAAAGQFLISYTSPKYGWQSGYFLVIAIDITVTLVPVLSIFYQEVKEIC